jgi:copper chaperone
VTIDTDDESVRNATIKALLTMGYPEQGSVEGLDALKGKAKSVVSCAIGKIS